MGFKYNPAFQGDCGTAFPMDVAELEEDADFVYTTDTDESITEGVVTATAAVTNTRVVELPPLYETVDTDALDELFAPQLGETKNRTVRVTFTYFDCDVVVLRNGRIFIEADS